VNPAVAERPLPVRDLPRTIGRADASWRSPDSSGGGGLTLEARLDCVWEGLRADGAADCPLCGGQMAAGPPGQAARCAHCRSRLR
jgi:hypothetical protein